MSLASLVNFTCTVSLRAKAGGLRRGFHFSRATDPTLPEESAATALLNPRTLSIRLEAEECH